MSQQQCLYKGNCGGEAKATLGDVGHAIQSFAEKNNYSVVRGILWSWHWIENA